MVVVQFACGQEDRMSDLIGPFEYVEMTYDVLWTPGRGEVIASYVDGWWVHKGERYSDFSVGTP